jgi:hypothetical protein
MDMPKVFGVENTIHSDAPNEYKQEALRWARQKVSNQLFDILWQSKLPAVVDIDEKIDYSYQNYFMQIPNDRIKIVVTITPVQHRHIEMMSTPYGYTDRMKFGNHENIFKKLIKKLKRII